MHLHKLLQCDLPFPAACTLAPNATMEGRECLPLPDWGPVVGVIMGVLTTLLEP